MAKWEEMIRPVSTQVVKREEPMTGSGLGLVGAGVTDRIGGGSDSLSAGERAAFDAEWTAAPLQVPVGGSIERALDEHSPDIVAEIDAYLRARRGRMTRLVVAALLLQVGPLSAQEVPPPGNWRGALTRADSLYREAIGLVEAARAALERRDGAALDEAVRA